MPSAPAETELQSQFAADLRAREEEWERVAESRTRAVETRVSHEAQQKEELFQAKLRQRDQQWQTKLDAARGELQAQAEALRRREADADARVREVEANLRKELQEKEEAVRAEAQNREQELVAQMTAAAEARHTAAQAQWETESETKLRAATEPLKAQLARAEKERDEARQAAFEHSRQVQNMEKSSPKSPRSSTPGETAKTSSEYNPGSASVPPAVHLCETGGLQKAP